MTSEKAESLKAELAELIAANEAATSWGAAVGARSERIRGIQRTLCALEHPTEKAEPVAWRWQHVNDPTQSWTYQTRPIEGHNEYLRVETLYATPPRDDVQGEVLKAALRAFIKAYGSQDSGTYGLDLAMAQAKAALSETHPVELPDYECENCIGMIEHGCYCKALGAVAPGGPLPETKPAQGDAQSVKDMEMIYNALSQAQDCIRGETPEDMTDAEAREDTINKIRDAMRAVETKPAQGAKLATFILEYARDLRRNSSGGDNYPWEYAKATADHLEELVRRSETKPAQAPDIQSEEALKLVFEAAYGLCMGYDWNNGTHAKLHGYRRNLLNAVNAIREVPDFKGKCRVTAQGDAVAALRDIISIARDAHATDALGDIVRRAEEELANVR